VNAQTVTRRPAAKAGQRKRPAARRGGKAGVDLSGLGRLATWALAAFLVILTVVAAIAFDLPAKAGQAIGSASGRAGFAVNGYQIVGIHRMSRRLVDSVVTDELHRAVQVEGSSARPPQALVSLDAIRDRLMRYGWVKDARVSRRLPDTLVIDIVERQPAAVWQNKQQLSLIDGQGVVLASVPVDRMPDLPLLIGPAANNKAASLNQMLGQVPTLRPQLASATWIGDRRWDLAFTSGETLALPEGDSAAAKALARFAKMDRSNGLLGRGFLRFDLRQPGKMIVRVPRAPGEAISTDLPETTN
jgi:cell division protein FtsQ